MAKIKRVRFAAGVKTDNPKPPKKVCITNRPVKTASEMSTSSAEKDVEKSERDIAELIAAIEACKTDEEGEALAARLIAATKTSTELKHVCDFLLPRGRDLFYTYVAISGEMNQRREKEAVEKERKEAVEKERKEAETTTTVSVRVSNDKGVQPALDYYRGASSHLKDEYKQQLQEFINRQDNIPAYCTASSGNGKTQMAFALSHHYPVLFIPFVRNGKDTQDIYKPFSWSAAALEKAFSKDFDNNPDIMSGLSAKNLKTSNECLFIAGVLRHILILDSEPEKPKLITLAKEESAKRVAACSISDLKNCVDRCKTPVVAVLDEFLDQPSVFVTATVLRAAGVRVITAGTNSSLNNFTSFQQSRNMSKKDDSEQKTSEPQSPNAKQKTVANSVNTPKGQKRRDNIYLISRLPEMKIRVPLRLSVDTSDTEVERELDNVLQGVPEPWLSFLRYSIKKGRGLFSHMLVQEMRRNALKENEDKYERLGKILFAVRKEIIDLKRKNDQDAFLKYQVFFHLSSMFVHAGDVKFTGPINRHYGKMQFASNCFLSQSGRELKYKAKGAAAYEDWSLKHCFSSPIEEPLLHLFAGAFEGGHPFQDPRPGSNGFLPIYAAITYLQKVQEISDNLFANASENRNSGYKLEALAAAIISIASRRRTNLEKQNGWEFISKVAVEARREGGYENVTLKSECPQVKSFLQKIETKFSLLSTDEKDGIQSIEGCEEFGSVWRTQNEQFDINTNFGVAAECKDWGKPLGAAQIRTITIKRPPTAKLFLIFCNDVVDASRTTNCLNDLISSGVAFVIMKKEESEEHGYSINLDPLFDTNIPEKEEEEEIKTLTIVVPSL